MTYEELCSAMGEAECRLLMLKQAFLAQHNDGLKRAAAQAKAEERDEILASLHTALYIIPADAPAYTGLMQALDIINTRG